MGIFVPDVLNPESCTSGAGLPGHGGTELPIFGLCTPGVGNVQIQRRDLVPVGCICKLQLIELTTEH